MKKIAITGMAIILFFILFACSSIEEQEPTTVETQAISEQISTTTHPIVIESRPWHDPAFNWTDVLISFPEQFIVRTEDTDWWGFERQFRIAFYALDNPDAISSVSSENRREWFFNEVEQNVERTEPLTLSFIKRFDITFAEFERVVKESYLFHRELEIDMADEDNEISNPHLLFTFNIERINDYYSIDPVRHASAREWLEEWLQENEPYESYSAFRAANP